MTEIVSSLEKYAEHQPGTTLVVDRLYGSLDLVQYYAEKGVYVVAKCKSDRPSWLFKDFLHSFLDKKTLEATQYCSGVFPCGTTFLAQSTVYEMKNDNPVITNFLTTNPQLIRNCTNEHYAQTQESQKEKESMLLM